MSAVKIKIIDEDAHEGIKSKKKKETVSKVSKKKSVKKIEKNIVQKASEEKIPKKKVLSTEKKPKKNLKIKEEIKKEEIKNDIFANIDSVKKIIEESEPEKEKNEDRVYISNNKNKENREELIGHLNKQNQSFNNQNSDSEEDFNLEEEYLEEEYNVKSLNLYKKIAYFFIFLVLVSVSFVLYFSFVRVEIVLIPNQEKISNNMIFDIYDKDKEDIKTTMIPGAVRGETIESSSTFESSGTEVIGKEAVGEVTIINNYSQNQPLVASTRMIPANDVDKLFRLKETVNVPAGGEVKAEVYADDPSPEMAIKATRFTIPGLWAGLQDKIYAESDSDIVYRQKVKKYIVDSDFDNAKKALRQKLLSEAKAEINKAYKEYGKIIYKIDENSIVNNFDNEAGEELDEFKASIRADVIIVAFDEKKAALMAQQKFMASLSSDKELISFDESNIIYALNKYDTDKGEATVSASFEGRVSIKEDANVVVANDILGLKKDQLDVYLGSKTELAGYEIKFYPSFLPGFLKKVPRLVDKVKIEIKK